MSGLPDLMAPSSVSLAPGLRRDWRRSQFGDEPQDVDEPFQDGGTPCRVTEPVGHPDVALAVDAEAAAAEAGLESLDLAGIGGWKARDEVADGIGHPDPVLLVDAEVERPSKRFARFILESLAEQLALRQIALGEVNYLILRDPTTQTSPLGVMITPCMSPSLPSKVMPSGGVSGLPFLSNTAMDLPP